MSGRSWPFVPSAKPSKLHVYTFRHVDSLEFLHAAGAFSGDSDECTLTIRAVIAGCNCTVRYIRSLLQMSVAFFTKENFALRETNCEEITLQILLQSP